MKILKIHITPMQKFQIKSQYPEFDEQNYGTQGRFAGGGLAKLAGKRSGHHQNQDLHHRAWIIY